MTERWRTGTSEHRWEYGVEVTQPDGTVLVYWRHTRPDAEALLAEPSSAVGRRLVRRLITTGPAEEVPEDG